MKKIIELEKISSVIKSGDRIMVGGFAGSGNPMKIIHAIADSEITNLTLIGNDTGDCYILKDHVGILVDKKKISKAIVSHIGRNPETCRQFQNNEIEIEFVPQGTLVERIRCAGFGLGAAITKTGLGTEVAKGKQTITIDGEEYLVELPLFADVAVVKVKKADKLGNILMYGTNKSHSVMMLTAAKTTIVEAEEIVEIGDLEPNEITLPGIFIDYIVKGDEKHAR